MTPATRMPSLLQRLGDAGRAPGAVAFAGDEERRVPRVEAREIDADELGDRRDVAERVVELRAVLRPRRPAEPGADRVDEDEIRMLEPRRVVVLERRTRRTPTAPRESASRFGPKPTRCSSVEFEPGPPFHRNVSGRRVRCGPATVYAT